MSKSPMEVVQAFYLRHLFAFLSFVIPTLILGFGYKFGLFEKEYEDLQMYRNDISMFYAFGSLFIQAAFWGYICFKLFLNETFLMRSLKLFALAFPIGLSFGVCVIAAKHTMNSVNNFVLYETGFTFLMYLIVCPLISLSYTFKSEK